VAGRLIECVPNFSEGRDETVVHAIRDAIASVDGVQMLRWEMDPDHNRSVMTFAGSPEAVPEGAFRGIAKAVEVIDLRKHKGVHPRMGAADVVPFVPLAGVSMEECAGIAHRVGKAVRNKLGVPVYFYEAAALNPNRVPLENCRRGGFENPSVAPDVGGPSLHPSAGASIIGARKLLIAFNVNLNTTDGGVARAIARKVRGSTGGLPFLKAIGTTLASRNLVQVAMNLTNFEVTPLDQVFEAVQNEAISHGVSIADTELIGMAPRRSRIEELAKGLKIRDFGPERVLETLLPTLE
jgi:glutamate formiminotransferase